MNLNKKTVISRGLLPVYYSTTSGMSKQYANKFQSKVEEIGFTAPVMNVGDINIEDFLNYQGTIVMFLSTYGNGDSPDDGQNFLKWIKHLKPEGSLKKLSFLIMAFGNSTFQDFCGHGRKMTQCLVSNGAQMLMETKKCDANIESQNANRVFDPWSQKVLNLLSLKYELKEMLLEQLIGGFTVQIRQQKINWEAQLAEKQQNFGKEFSNYLKTQKAEVVHIQELRNDVAHSQRSTLWVRIKKPQGLMLWPGCNVNVYPENLVPLNQWEQNQSITFASRKANSKVPFPTMSITDLKKLINMRQKPSNKLLKNAILMSQKPNQIKERYKTIIRENKIDEVTCQQILEDLEPSYEFYADLGINLPRIYTLASWDPAKQHIDLCVSTLKLGLASQYLKSLPTYLRISSSESSFSIPSKPLIMIANGSGIAPFHSIVEYLAQQPAQNQVPLKLYYGIQDKDTDYYFRKDFEKYEKQGILQIRLAQSRKDPNRKQYIQELVEHDKQLFREHLFRKEGHVYICGGREMEKAVNAAIFKAITLECKIPYKGFTILNEFKTKKVIVQEVFG